MIRIGDSNVYLDVLVKSSEHICFLSIYDNSLQRIKAFCARMNIGEENLILEGDSVPNGGHYNSYISPVVREKERFYHAVVVNQQIKKQIIMTTEERCGTDFYNYLMREYDLPLLDWWGKELLDEAVRGNYVKALPADIVYGKFSFLEKNLLGDTIPFESLWIYEMGLYTEDVLTSHIKNLFASGRIWISRQPQKKLEVSDMDDYFGKYGHALVAALEKQIHPLTGLNGNCTSLLLKRKRLYPQQVAMVNGVLALLRTSSYAILNEGMGVGKTLQAASICEGYFVERYFRMYPKASLKEIYSDKYVITYRNIVMAPGHMVEKWAKEIKNEVPFSDVTILNAFDQLIDIKENGPKREKKEYWIMSKDFAKLSYMSRPTPIKMRKKRPIRTKKCIAPGCGKTFLTPDCICPHCNNSGYELGEEIGTGEGLICPECGELLLEYRSISGNEKIVCLLPEDFSNPTNGNSKCYYCGAVLWQPHVGTVDMVNLRPEEKHTPWYRVTHYANKAHEATKCAWVHRKYADRYFTMIGEEPLNERPDTYGVRKYSPAEYIKRYMRGYWDFAVFDEAHLYKGGGTGQGYAMEALIKSSKKQLALTGTIAGGMAQHLFYLLFRLEPRRMIEMGYKWNDVMKFNKKYGTLETEYLVNIEYDDTGVACKAITRGKMLAEPRVKPGISPLIFTDFLLDRAVFLDLSDMSKYLPPLNEYVVPVELSQPEYGMKVSYEGVLYKIKQLLHEKGGRKLLGKMLQFSMSYLDHPYGPKKIVHPLDGSLVCEIQQYPELCTDGQMLSKEKKLMELVKKELDEGRRCVIYAEYTASPDTCVSYRIKQVLEEQLGIKVAVLESMSPEPLKREAWIHEQVERYKVDVIITNPRCVETGLDFCWETETDYFTIPTLIFYQMGYSLYTVWQASRRHFRLNQRMECRTYYMGIVNSIQMTAISITAEKQVATSAIQGKFTSEGLAAMAIGVDMKVRLAQALAEEDFEAGSDLQQMFDILAHEQESDDGSYDGYEQMKILEEVIGAEMARKLCMTTESIIDVDSLLNEILNGNQGGGMSNLLEEQSSVESIIVRDSDSLYDLFKL